jgi:hypothetical protein
MVESKFDKLADKIADEYERKGMSDEEAEKIGDATAAKIGFAKYGKRGMERKARAGRDAESFESACGCGSGSCGCGVEVHIHDAESKRRGPYVFPKRKAYPIGNLEHAKLALTFSTWPDNKKDAKKVRDAVFKRYPELRDWFKDGKYAKHAESFEAEKIEGQTQSNIYAKFFVGHVSNDELRGNGKFKTYDSAVKKAKEVAKKEGNSRVVSPMGAALWTSNDKGLFQAGHLTKEAKRFYDSEEEMAVGYLSAESLLYDAPMSTHDEYCIGQGRFCVSERLPGKDLCRNCDAEFGEMFPHDAEYTALGVPMRRMSAKEIMSPTSQWLRNGAIILGGLFLLSTASQAAPPEREV